MSETKKTVLLTGCEGQLGRCFVKHLQAAGHSVVGFDRAERSALPKVAYHQADITQPEQIQRALGRLAEPVDVLINNAGAQVFTPFELRTLDELDLVIGVNLKGTLLMTQAVFNAFMKPRRKGCIVSIGSIYGLVAGDMRLYKEGDRRTSEIYGATKAAVIHLTKYWAAYMAPYGVRVNCLSPGGVFNHQDPLFVEKYSAKVPFARMGDERELLSTLDCLISDSSSYLTGQNITVDGGLSAW